MNKAELESRVVDFIRRHRLLSPGGTVVVGVSGGADSVCLLHVLAKRQKALGISIHIAHLNHQLRGVESETDAKYVANLAGSLGIPVTIDTQDVAAYRINRNLSVEEAARELRYAFLARVAREVGANRIAVGHTRDDHVETILMHLLRGTGIAGLWGLAPCSPAVYDSQGMPFPASRVSLGDSPPSLRAGALSVAKGQQDNLLIIRPLLDITREETASYCHEHGLDPRIDSSNRSLSFFRNRLRLQLLPLLRTYNPSIDQALLRLADIAREDEAFIEQEVSGLWDKVTQQDNNSIWLDRKQIASLPIALQRQLLRAAVIKLVGDARDIEATHIEAARSLLNKPVGKRVSLPRGFVCQGGYNEIIITSTAKQHHLPPSPFPPLAGQFPLRVPGRTFFPGWKVTATIVGERTDSLSLRGSPSAGKQAWQSNLAADFDLHKTGSELFVRQRQPGDRFQPLGLDMPKKLQEFMVDVKIPRSWRGRIPVVCSPQQIIWVVGWRIDDRVKVSELSKEILHLEFIRPE
jgi:tRNA(Ile)-lysidine synthase